MIRDFDPDVADFYDDYSRFTRFLIALVILNWKWLKEPRVCYFLFCSEEVRLGQESLKRKMNKLYYQSVLMRND